jgi:tricorn protease-like protein
MKQLLAALLIVVTAYTMISCKGAGGKKTLCDSTCLKDTIKFYGDHELKPYVFIIPRNCGADSIVWSYTGMGINRKTSFDYTDLKLNKDFIRCVFSDTGYVVLLFNDCETGRGFQIKLPYDKSATMSKRTSGINNMDPKFNIPDNMITFTDRGNIYVEEPSTGKKAMMTFGEAVDMDYDAIHETLDSVNVSAERIWVKIKIANEWKEIEKQIKLE